MAQQQPRQLDVAIREARIIPRLALREDEAAASFGISLNTFLDLVREGKMPKPVRIRPRLPRYDFEDLCKAWQALKESQGTTDDGNDFDR